MADKVKEMEDLLGKLEALQREHSELETKHTTTVVSSCQYLHTGSLALTTYM